MNEIIVVVILGRSYFYCIRIFLLYFLILVCVFEGRFKLIKISIERLLWACIWGLSLSFLFLGFRFWGGRIIESFMMWGNRVVIGISRDVAGVGKKRRKCF